MSPRKAKLPDAKFKVGQVVCITGMDPPAYEKLKSRDDDEGYWNTDSGYFYPEEMRPLTRRERGGV